MSLTEIKQPTFVDKYKPTRVEDLILPSNHAVGAAVKFLQKPYPSGWLLYGGSGLGKTTMAEMMAIAAAEHPYSVQTFAGQELDVNQVKQLKFTCSTIPLFGRMHAIVVNEADAIPVGGRLALLALLEIYRHSCWIFTSNKSVKDFDSPFRSRLRPQLFKGQGICTPASKLLVRIARNEGLDLAITEAEAIMKEVKNNIRGALNALEIMCTERRSDVGLKSVDFSQQAA